MGEWVGSDVFKWAGWVSLWCVGMGGWVDLWNGWIVGMGGLIDGYSNGNVVSKCITLVAVLGGTL